MEKAFHDLGRAQLAGTEHLHGPEWTLVHAYGLRPGLLAMSHVWQAAEGDRRSWSRPRARLKPSPTCATSTLRIAPR